jgi:hypothetical protein
MATAVVAGALANKSGNGGEAWVRMSWVLGLRDLGFEVLFVEEIDPALCIDGAGRTVSVAASVQGAYFEQVTAQFELSGSVSLLCGNDSIGLSRSELADRMAGADILLNISGHLRDRALLGAVGTRVYLDVDPGFTQIWHQDGIGDLGLDDHNLHYTIGENIGMNGCPVPCGGIRWRPTRQPVVLSEWPVCPAAPIRDFSTVGNWRGPYGRPVLDGKLLGLKLHRFRALVDLPTRTDHLFEAAMAFGPGDGADRDAMEAGGWRITDPAAVAASPDDFRTFVASSGAEISAAQGVYVETGCGWLSDRTARYLASGRPAIVEDTALGTRLPLGVGLVPFATPDQAALAVELVQSDYATHSAAARALAEEYLASDKVIGRLLEDACVAP